MRNRLLGEGERERGGGRKREKRERGRKRERAREIEREAGQRASNESLASRFFESARINKIRFEKNSSCLRRIALNWEEFSLTGKCLDSLERVQLV